MQFKCHLNDEYISEYRPTLCQMSHYNIHFDDLNLSLEIVLSLEFCVCVYYMPKYKIRNFVNIFIKQSAWL